MRIEIQRDAPVVYPMICPCCSQPANATESVEGTQPMGTSTLTVRTEVPICRACLMHRLVGRHLALRVVFGGVILLALGFSVDFVANPARGSVLYWLQEALAMLFVSSLVVAPAAYLWDRLRWSRSHPDHAAVGGVVRLYWTAFGTAFDFRNTAYAEQFRALNAAHLVRFSHTVQPN